MKEVVAKGADVVCTFVAKMLTKTGCLWGCHREDAPDELFN